MDEIDFTLDGTRYHLTREAVIRAMRKQFPGRLQTWAVDVEGVRFPVKQVLAQALQIPTTAFISTRAQDLLRKLGFDVVNLEEEGSPLDGQEATSPTRRTALELAIQFAAGRDALDEDDVVRVAKRFEAFLT
jgi:hypothetical protein